MSQCYAPNAVPVPEYGPCNASEGVSLCCTPGQICLTNGLCATGQGQFYSGACTDKTYKAAICPSFCMGADKFVVECHNSVIPDGGFCCDGTGVGTCCGSASNKLDLDPSVSSAVAAPASSSGTVAATLNSGSERDSKTSSTEPTSNAGVMSTSVATDAGRTSTQMVASTVTSTLVPVSSASTTSNEKGKSDNHNLNTGVYIGITVAALLIIALISYLLKKLKEWFDRRQIRRKGAHTAADVGGSQANKSEDNVHELQDLPAPMPELDHRDSPKEPTIHEMDAASGAINNDRRTATPSHRVINPFDSSPISPISTLSTHGPPSSPPANPAVARMDGGITPPKPVVFGAADADGSSIFPVTPPPSYETIEQVVSSQSEGSSTLPTDEPTKVRSLV